MMFQRLKKQREEVLATKSENTRTHTSSSSNKQQRKKLSRSSKTKTNDSRCSSSSSSSSSSNKVFDLLQNDPNYVLRLCQKGNNTASRSLSTKWSSIERCCKWISEAAAEDSCFVADSAKLQLQFQQTDDWGNTPLHIICYNKPPPYIIEAYLNAFRSCCTSLESTLLTTSNDKGATPLLVSCKSGSCRNTIKALLRGDDGNKAITMCDNDGITVFDALLNRYKLVKRIPALREHWTDIDTIEKEELALMNTSSETSNINGDDDKVELGPVELLSSFDKDKTTTTTATTTTTVQPTNKTSAAVPSSHYLFPLFWRVNEDLIHSAWNMEVSSPSWDGTKTTEYISDLHGAALIADCLPETIIDMILRVNVNDNDDDDDKDYPDNVKLSPLYLAFVRRIGYHPKLQRQHAYFCKKLIEKDPSVFMAAASSKVCSRSLFCQAIASGYHWNLLNEIQDKGATTAEGDEEEEDRLQGPVQLLFRQDPNAIAEVDKETGLLPFMLAAAAAPTLANTTTTTTNTTAKEEYNTQEQEHESNLQLDTIYNLLRTSPESIQR